MKKNQRSSGDLSISKEAVRSEDADPLKAISEKARLSEGEEAVRRILREIYRRGRIGTKDLAYASTLPVPVVAAVRKELEKSGLISRNGGAILTDKGRRYVAETLGFTENEPLSCLACLGRKIMVPKKYASILTKLQEYSRFRPKPYTWLDQAFATPQTMLLRALFMLEEGDVEGRNILFLGDDDLTSVATGLLKSAKKITVIDIDDRILDLITSIAEKEDLQIECIRHDLRNPLPSKLNAKYDVVFTDPPYTMEGLKVFVSRGIKALRKRRCASIYLAFAHKLPEEMLHLQRAINDMGLVTREIVPRFNVYEGAEMLANTTFLAKLETTDETKPSITSRHEGKMYSGEVSPTLRIYRCSCGEEIEVGSGAQFRTIEMLKSDGCPKCGRKEGFKLQKRLKLKPKHRSNLKPTLKR
jgi:predicted methyltransferase